jgi:hypothetical protein
MSSLTALEDLGIAGHYFQRSALVRIAPVGFEVGLHLSILDDSGPHAVALVVVVQLPLDRALVLLVVVELVHDF